MSHQAGKRARARARATGQHALAVLSKFLTFTSLRIRSIPGKLGLPELLISELRKTTNADTRSRLLLHTQAAWPSSLQRVDDTHLQAPKLLSTVQHPSEINARPSGLNAGRPALR